MKYHRNLECWLTILLLLVTVVLSIVAYVFWYRLTFFIGNYLFIHWLGLIATSYVAISNPIHYFLKRKRRQNYKTILKIHVFGNLFAFLLISLHFAQNVGRLTGSLQTLSEGFVLYLLLSLIVLTGIIERYQNIGNLSRVVRGVHIYTVIILYFIMLIHILEGFNLL